jgi:hypothetical protein
LLIHNLLVSAFFYNVEAPRDAEGDREHGNPTRAHDPDYYALDAS